MRRRSNGAKTTKVLMSRYLTGVQFDTGKSMVGAREKMRVQSAEPGPAVCVSKAARGNGCERFVNSAKQRAALMFTRITQAAAG